MTVLYWVRELCGFYVVLTLSATGLAKLWSLRRASRGVSAEGVIPAAVAPGLVGMVSVTEVALAGLFVAGAQARLVGFTAALLFLGFGAYKVAVVARTGLSSCNCTGTTIAYKATRPNVFGAVAASVIQATAAFAWAILPADSTSYFSVIGLIALSIPIIVVLFGYLSRRGGRGQPSLSPQYDEHDHRNAEPVNR